MPSGFFQWNLGKRNPVVPDDFNLGAEHQQILHQVVGKGIIVVDHENHFIPPSCRKSQVSQFHQPLTTNHYVTVQK